MRKRKRLSGVLLVIAALVIMQLPVSEADAATSSASDFRIEGSTLVKYRGTETNVSVPDTVEVIGEGAFENNTTVELVVLPNSVKRIEKYAFWGCDNLDTVVLGRGLAAVGDYAFAGCKGLEQIIIPSNVTSIGVQSFGDCVNLKDVTIPKETTSIHETAFDGCYQLSFHTETGSAADLFAKAFYERQGESAEYQDVPGYNTTDGTISQPKPQKTTAPTSDPTTAPVPNSDGGDVLGSSAVVGNRAVVFIDSENLSVYDANATPAPQVPETDFSQALQTGGLPKYSIVDGSVVADQAFYRSEGLSVVTLPEGIREIGQFSFARSSATEVIVPAAVESIGYGAFYHCDQLSAVTLLGTVMNVEPKAFEHTAWVDSFLDGSSDVTGDFLISGGVLIAYRGSSQAVIVPEGVRVIAAEAFMGHEEMTSVTLPGSLLVIGEGAFEACTGLHSIHLNQGLEQIKDRAFYHCSATRVSVPDSVSSIGLLALDEIAVTYQGEVPGTTYEASATRLSNESYRAPEADPDAVASGVVVEGPEGASAALEGAARLYTLLVTDSSDTADMERAFVRALGSGIPSGSYVYDMQLTDNSGIPLTKLGRQVLTVILPLPDSLQGKQLQLYGLDRNGQLEEIAVEPVTVEGRNAVRFRTNSVSRICLGTTGDSAAQQPVEINVSMADYGAPPESAGVSVFSVIRLILSCTLLFAGVLLFCLGKSAKSTSKPVKHTG